MPTTPLLHAGPPLPEPISSLPVVGVTHHPDQTAKGELCLPCRVPLVITSVLLPLAPWQGQYQRRKELEGRITQAQLLRSTHPVNHSGQWFEWLQRRQHLQRARLLRESGLPGAAQRFI